MAHALTDASNLRGFADRIVVARSTADVIGTAEHCQRHSIPLTVIAGRSATTGAAVPQGGWALDMTAMNRIVVVGDRMAEAQTGVLLGDLDRAVARTSQRFPPDPTNRSVSTLGGAIACNASGPRSYRYGPTRAWIDGLEVVLPTGQCLNIDSNTAIPDGWPVPAWKAPSCKNAAGYATDGSLLDLFVGHEGTLGIATRARVRLDRRPAGVLAAIAFFEHVESALAFASDVRAQSRSSTHTMEAASIEYLDPACVALVARQQCDLPRRAHAVWCEQDLATAEGDESIEAEWIDTMTSNGARIEASSITHNAAEIARWQQLRHKIPLHIHETLVATGMPKVGTDFAVPIDNLPELMTAYAGAPIPHLLFGHLGDGHLHLNMLPRSPEEYDTARAFVSTLAASVVAMGGTVSAEHGIGKLKHALFQQMASPEVVEAFRALQRAVDPLRILGRGNVIPYVA